MSERVRLTDVTKVYQGGITGALNGLSVVQRRDWAGDQARGKRQ
jgi:hypothetical protein